MRRIFLLTLLFFSLPLWADPCSELKSEQKSLVKNTIYVNTHEGEKSCYERCIAHQKLQHTIRFVCRNMPEPTTNSDLEDNWEKSCEALISSIVQTGKEGCRIAGTPSFNCYYQEKPAD